MEKLFISSTSYATKNDLCINAITFYASLSPRLSPILN